MFCGCTCIIALIFLIANIYTILSCTNDNYKQEFKNTLSNDQKVTYEKIINERKNIYYGGYVFGLILSLIVILILKKFFKSKFNNLSLICLVGTITFVSNYLFYILYPKSDYMLLHLNDKTQIEGWLKIYKKMQFKFHLGFVLGIIAVIIFCYSFRNN
tara:strand:+ start:4061 stop:4534 length:474 start_codon:yes stop_codon:yes gene_type:complete